MLKKSLFLIILVLFFAYQTTIVEAREIILESGTKIKLKLGNKISTATSKEGDKVNLIVADDVMFGDIPLLKAGSYAVGIITELQPKGNFFKEGYLRISLDYAKAIDGQKISIYGDFEREGTPAMTNYYGMGMVFTPIFSFLKGDILLKGNDATLPQGYIVRARVEKDTNISVSDFIVPVKNKK